LKPRFTPKPGQYLAFIHSYTKLHRTPPAEADLQRYFKVTPPAVHAMVLTAIGGGSSSGHPAKLGQFGFEFRRRSYQTWCEDDRAV
jgi:hypothetical protein